MQKIITWNLKSGSNSKSSSMLHARFPLRQFESSRVIPKLIAESIKVALRVAPTVAAAAAANSNKRLACLPSHARPPSHPEISLQRRAQQWCRYPRGTGGSDPFWRKNLFWKMCSFWRTLRSFQVFWTVFLIMRHAYGHDVYLPSTSTCFNALRLVNAKKELKSTAKNSATGSKPTSMTNKTNINIV